MDYLKNARGLNTLMGKFFCRELISRIEKVNFLRVFDFANFRKFYEFFFSRFISTNLPRIEIILRTLALKRKLKLYSPHTKKTKK